MWRAAASPVLVCRAALRQPPPARDQMWRAAASPVLVCRAALRQPRPHSQQLLLRRAFSSPSSAADELLKRQIAENACFVVSKRTCPFCMMAKRALDSVGARYAVMELDGRPDGPLIQDALEVMTGMRTVPNVFVGGKSIGGATETLSLLQSGELESILQEAGAID